MDALCWTVVGFAALVGLVVGVIATASGFFVRPLDLRRSKDDE